jgi:hypothetical protein
MTLRYWGMEEVNDFVTKKVLVIRKLKLSGGVSNFFETRDVFYKRPLTVKSNKLKIRKDRKTGLFKTQGSIIFFLLLRLLSPFSSNFVLSYKHSILTAKIRNE